MNNNPLKTSLREALHQTELPADRKHFESTLFLAKRQAQHIQRRKRISFARFLAAQIRFIGWKLWVMQGLLLAAVHALLFPLYREAHPRYIVSLLFCLSILALMTALPFLYRSVRYQMQEVESAARFSLGKLLTAKLAMIGIGDFFLLGAIFAIALRKTSLPAESIFISLCFPFLLSCAGCLFLLGHLRARNFFIGSIGLCSLLLLLAVLLMRRYETTLQYAHSGRGIAACLLLLLACICEYRHIIYRSAYAERQLT